MWTKKMTPAGQLAGLFAMLTFCLFPLVMPVLTLAARHAEDKKINCNTRQDCVKACARDARYCERAKEFVLGR